MRADCWLHLAVHGLLDPFVVICEHTQIFNIAEVFIAIGILIVFFKDNLFWGFFVAKSIVAAVTVVVIRTGNEFYSLFSATII